MESHIVQDSLPDDTYRVSDYTEWLTEHTTVWAWGAFAYPDMTIFAPLGTLGERRDLVAGIIRRKIAEGALS